jgi:hypothetical protein
MAEEKNNENPSRSPEAPANTAESSARRNFMKNVVVAGAVATTGLAAIATAPSAHAACTQLSPEVIKDVTALASKYGRLVDILCYGQPAPDVIAGTVQVSAGATGALIEALGKYDKARFNCEVFPRGIPWPEFFDVVFKTPGANY